jgi:hypothetical protein
LHLKLEKKERPLLQSSGQQHAIHGQKAKFPEVEQKLVFILK